MKALILAAGKGTRLRPLTDNRPKVLVEVNGKPLIEHVIDGIRSLGIEEITVIKGYMGSMLEERLSKYEGLTFLEQKEQLGTAHAIGMSSFDSPFLTMSGDVLTHTENIEKVVSRFEKGGWKAVIGSFEVENPEEFGVLEVEGDRVRDIAEKPDNPPSNLINTGTYVFPPEIYDYIDRTGLSERGEYEITDSIEMMLEDGLSVAHAKFDNYWIDVGRHEDLERARNLVNKNGNEDK